MSSEYSWSLNTGIGNSLHVPNISEELITTSISPVVKSGLIASEERLTQEPSILTTVSSLSFSNSENEESSFWTTHCVIP